MREGVKRGTAAERGREGGREGGTSTRPKYENPTTPAPNLHAQFTGRLTVLASEEEDEPVTMEDRERIYADKRDSDVVVEEGNKYVACFDPLDGSSNVDGMWMYYFLSLFIYLFIHWCSILLNPNATYITLIFLPSFLLYSPSIYPCGDHLRYLCQWR